MSDHLPLSGKRIVVTRARRQAPPLETLITERGGIPVLYPCIEIAPLTDHDALDIHLRNLGNFDWLAFTSGNAVWAIAERARAIDIEQDLSRAKIAALGPATSAELRRQLSRDADFTPAAYSAENLARQLPLSQGDRILLPQSNLADHKAADILRSRGADLTALVAYRTLVGRGGIDLPAQIATGRIDALTFASPSAVRFFRQRCPQEDALSLPTLCLAPSTAKAAAEQGFHELITPPTISLPAMMASLSDYFAERADAP